MRFCRHHLAKTVPMDAPLVTIPLIALLVILLLNTIIKITTAILATKFQNISILTHKSVRCVQKAVFIVIQYLIVLSVIGIFSIK